jgi:hypothetical protein
VTSRPDVITFPAPTAANWGPIICAWVPFDRRDVRRTTPKEIRRYRYVRQFHRRQLQSWGFDTGLWFRGIIVLHFDPAARHRAREAVRRWEAST